MNSDPSRLDHQRRLEAEALAHCDSEPIHVPGCIQAFGGLVATDPLLDQFEFCSANVDQYGWDPGELTARSPRDVLGEDLLHDVRNVLSHSAASTQRMTVGELELNGVSHELFAHVNCQERAILELEPLHEFDADGPTLDDLRRLVDRVAHAETVSKLLNGATEDLQALIGFDRVMAYRFLANGDGEVVAEARSSGGVESFLGLRYPAWDIPAQARSLYLQNPVRVIGDVCGEPVPVHRLQSGIEPLDLSLAHLRGTSPVHLQYLQNMGVEATMSLALIVRGRLWGLLACHHLSPRLLTYGIRASCEIFAQMMSLLIQQRMEVEVSITRARIERGRRRLVSVMRDQDSEFRDAEPMLEVLLETVVCDGVALVKGRANYTRGHVPGDGVLATLAERRSGQHAVEAIEDLADALGSSSPGGEAGSHAVGGCLVVRLRDRNDWTILFFRDPVVSKITWAGKPVKSIDRSTGETRLLPRASFAAYIEEQAERCEPWTSEDLGHAREVDLLVTQWLDRVEVQAAEDRVQRLRQRQQQVMIAELNHRVRNVLALVQAMAHRAKETSMDVEQFVRVLEGRIAALAGAHGFAYQLEGAGVELTRMLRAELAPYMGGDSPRIEVAGPTVFLQADSAPLVALVVHELATNAAKHGSLSVAEGSLRVTWRREASGLVLEWRESDGPRVEPPRRTGFGHTLINRIIPFELEGRVEQRFEPDGSAVPGVDWRGRPGGPPAGPGSYVERGCERRGVCRDGQ